LLGLLSAVLALGCLTPNGNDEASETGGMGTGENRRTRLRNRPANFTPGHSRMLVRFEVGPEGGSWSGIGAPDIDFEVSILVPTEAVDREVQVVLALDDGALYLSAGRESGIVLDFQADRPKFDLPVRIVIERDAQNDPGIPVGYAIETSGRLRAIDMLWDKPTGNLTFLTHRPVKMTWVYAEP